MLKLYERIAFACLAILAAVLASFAGDGMAQTIYYALCVVMLLRVL